MLQRIPGLRTLVRRRRLARLAGEAPARSAAEQTTTARTWKPGSAAERQYSFLMTK